MEIVEAGCVAEAPSTLRDAFGDALLRWNTRRAACASRVKKRTSLKKCGEVDVTSRYDDRGTLSQRCRASPTKYDQYTLIFHSARGDGGKGTNRNYEGFLFRNTRLSAAVFSTCWLPLTLSRSLLLSVSA